YVQPYSCSGGDYWTYSGIGRFICPKCGTPSRFYDFRDRDKGKSYEEQKKQEKYFSKLEKVFGGIVEVYPANTSDRNSRTRIEKCSWSKSIPAEVFERCAEILA
ncbi:unnamed protein product, partial [marine sediment metagenome]